MLFQPRGAQIEALCALENSRAEGAVREGLVHAKPVSARLIWQHLILQSMKGYCLLPIEKKF